MVVGGVWTAQGNMAAEIRSHPGSRYRLPRLDSTPLNKSPSPDYFDSFWTTMEAFIAMNFRGTSAGVRGGMIVDALGWNPAEPAAPRHLDIDRITSEHDR